MGAVAGAGAVCVGVALLCCGYVGIAARGRGGSNWSWNYQLLTGIQQEVHVKSRDFTMNMWSRESLAAGTNILGLHVSSRSVSAFTGMHVNSHDFTQVAARQPEA